MYTVSDAYKTAIAAPTRKCEWRGTLTLSTGTVMEITPDMIATGSGGITASCCGSDAIEIGGVYASELTLEIMTDIDRYAVVGATVAMIFRTYLTATTFEDVPTGIYTVSEATRTKRTLSLTAYDNMVRFDDTPFTAQTGGTAYALLSNACAACGVELGMTEAQVLAFSNGKFVMSVYEQNDIQSYRDLIHYVAAALGGFAYIDRAGKLTIKAYGMTPVKTVTPALRFGSALSDFETRFTAISSNYDVTQTAEYYNVEPDDGLTMNLGGNPLLQFGAEANRITMLQNVLTMISSFTYTPCDVELPADPAMDIGDCITLSGGQAVTGKVSCATGIDLDFYGHMTVRCVGENPRLATAKSKIDKNLAGIMSTISGKDVIIYAYTNSQTYTIGETEHTVLQISYLTVSEAKPVFIYSIPHTLSLDGNVVARLYIDEVLAETYRQYEDRGGHVLTVSKHFDDEASVRHVIKVTLAFEVVSSDRRIDAAAIATGKNYSDALKAAVTDLAAAIAGKSTATLSLTGETQTVTPLAALSDISATVSYATVQPDTTAGTIHIDRAAIDAVLFAQGLAATDKWDGTLTLADDLPADLGMGAVTLEAMGEDFTTIFNSVTAQAFADALSADLDMGVTTLDGIKADLFSVHRTATDYIFGTAHAAAYTYDAAKVSISGNIFALADGVTEAQPITTDVITLSDTTVSIESVTTTAAGAPLFAYSFDSGATWIAWTGTEWATLTGTTTGMTAAIMGTITVDQWATAMTGATTIMVRAALQATGDTVTSIDINFADAK